VREQLRGGRPTSSRKGSSLRLPRFPIRIPESPGAASAAVCFFIVVSNRKLALLAVPKQSRSAICLTESLVSLRKLGRGEFRSSHELTQFPFPGPHPLSCSLQFKPSRN